MDKLTTLQKGQLLEMIVEYHNTWSIIESDPVVGMLFGAMQINFDLDRQKYEKICEKRAASGKQWWRPRKEENQEKANGFEEKAKKANGFLEKQTKAKKPKEEEKEDEEEDEDEEEYINTSDKSEGASSLVLPPEKLERKEKVDAIIETIRKACMDSDIVYAPDKRERMMAWNIIRSKQFIENAQLFNMDVHTFCANIVKVSSKIEFCPSIFNAKTIWYWYAEVIQRAKKQKMKLDNQKRWWIIEA